MMNECPFCKFKIVDLGFAEDCFECGTTILGDDIDRKNDCYKNQLAQQAEQIASLELALRSLEEHHEAQTKDLSDIIAQQAALLRRALAVVEAAAQPEGAWNRDREIYYKNIIEDLMGLAQALAPDLRTALGEKP